MHFTTVAELLHKLERKIAANLVKTPKKKKN